MLNGPLFFEVTALLLAAYLIGCIAGYNLHRLLARLRPPRPVAVPAPVSVAAAPVPPRPRRSPAARLAMAATPEEIAPIPVASTAPAPAIASGAPGPQALTGPRDGVEDNLRQIKGIGPKIEATLHALGIYHFDQIAAWTKADMDRMDIQLGFRGRVVREQWVPQAQALATSAAKAPAKRA